MYYYLYDSFLSDAKYEKIIDRIRTRLLDLEIQGKPGHLSLLKSANELIEDEVKNGIKTVVVVGNDKTFLKVINIVAKHNLTLGIIPIGEDNFIAESLGIPPQELACDILAARKVEVIDLGLANDVYFFSDIKIEKNLSRIGIKKDTYSIIPQASCQKVQIFNFCYKKEDIANNRILEKINPQDGLVDIVTIEKGNRVTGFLKSKKNNFKYSKTILPSKELEIKSFEYLPVKLDNSYVLKTPIKVKVAEKKLKLIVGRYRKF
ncbi:MAG TPA: diacylglycerol kinase family protein [Candidatus Bipolaricaulota bacterium]|nr:diacylglycerol kinase family protein [Candidatus Bipolaricaulota bacterium]